MQRITSSAEVREVLEAMGFTNLEQIKTATMEGWRARHRRSPRGVTITLREDLVGKDDEMLRVYVLEGGTPIRINDPRFEDVRGNIPANLDALMGFIDDLLHGSLKKKQNELLTKLELGPKVPVKA
ncbi:MAG: hypothetical protein M3Q73_01400 [bacterium]|nr:hypothetical protein [bacterium]